MPFKYQAQLDGIPDCPATHFVPRSVSAFRYVFSDKLAESFEPVLTKKPRRALDWNDAKRCSGWALSFFTSVRAAKEQFEAFKKVNPCIDKTLGDAIASGSITADDGVCCEPDSAGHFELHEHAGVELSHAFALVQALA
jgi:hypothetical protein